VEPYAVENLGEVLRALKTVERDVRLGVRKELRQAAEPIRADAAELTDTRIRNMYRSPRWSRMRVGVTQRVVYVAPRQRGVKSQPRQQLKRPNLADLMTTRAMQPSLDRHRTTVVREMEQMLDRAAAKFNRS